MIEKSHTAEDYFFSILDCAKVYCEYKNSDDSEELSDEDADKVMAYALYLDRLNKRTIEQTGEEL